MSPPGAGGGFLAGGPGGRGLGAPGGAGGRPAPAPAGGPGDGTMPPLRPWGPGPGGGAARRSGACGARRG
ncbi:MAG: hypothetical protein CW349_04160 [Firmicutes bacterium]|nr:hypothetical protein [Bacillota bacterium]MBO2518882.1 hypothetical protein [Bacillota bacterium]